MDRMSSVCECEGIPYRMTPELLDRAWASMFVKDEEIVRYPGTPVSSGHFQTSDFPLD